MGRRGGIAFTYIVNVIVVVFVVVDGVGGRDNERKEEEKRSAKFCATLCMVARWLGSMSVQNSKQITRLPSRIRSPETISPGRVALSMWYEVRVIAIVYSHPHKRSLDTSDLLSSRVSQ